MKISFLASHGGSSARHIIRAIHSKKLAAEIGIVVANNRDSVIYRWCHDNDIDVFYISAKTHPNSAEKDQAMYEALSAAGTDIIVLSGYMKKVGAVTLSAYTNKILNIHPSLLPRHGGKGLYGDKVHEAVLLSGDRESGATVQFVNAEYDEGPIIAQRKITICSHETPQSLKAKVQAIEGELYLSSIQKILGAQ